MKRLIHLWAIFFIFACLTGCGKGASEPTDSMIKEDLQHQLNEYRAQTESYALDVSEYEIIKSLTEDKTYSAQFNVTTQSQYANLYFTADVVYTLYDQGWSIDSCEWEMLDYEVVKYPTEAEVSSWESYDSATENKITGLDSYGDIFTVSGINKFSWCSYFMGEESFSTTYQYDVTDDQWVYCDKQQGEATYTLTEEFEKAWAGSVTDPGMKITNVEETGFDISTKNQTIEAKPYHVELDVNTTKKVNSYSNDNIFSMIFRSENEIEVYDVNRNCNQNGQLVITIWFYRTPETSGSESYDMMCAYAITTNGTDTLYPHMSYHIVN